MKRYFGILWLMWSAIWFLVSWPFVWLAYQFPYRLFPENRKLERGFAITRTWGKFVLFAIGVRLQIVGREQIDISRQHIYVCNHRSQIDIPVNFVSSPELFVILSKKEVEKLPVVGLNLKHAHVTVNRKSKEDRKRAMKKLNEYIQQGRSILLYPEGRRNRSTEHLGDFQAGAFVLAIQNKLPIVPVTIVGSEQINNPSAPFALHPGTVSVFYDDPIETDNFSQKDLPVLIQKTRAKMLTHFQ